MLFFFELKLGTLCNSCVIHTSHMIVPEIVMTGYWLTRKEEAAWVVEGEGAERR